MNNFKLVLKKIEIFSKKESNDVIHTLYLNEIILKDINLEKFKSQIEDYLYNKKIKISVWDSNCNFYYNNGITELHFEIISSNNEFYDNIFNWIDTELS